MGNRRFGFHSGTMKCQDAKIQGDCYVQDDIVFSDVSAGTLGITGGIDMQSTSSAIGIDLGGTFTTSAINIDGTLSGRAIRIGTKESSSTSLQIKSGSTVDAEPAQNYLFGLFTKVSASEATSTDELRSTWIRTRVNDGCHVGSNAGWGYGVCGAEIQLKVYADSAATNMYSWQNSAVWAQLETQGAGGVNFKTGSYSQCVLANVGLTATTTIDSGANVAGVTINSNTAAAVTATGGFYGLFITQKTAGLLDFQHAIYIASGSSDSGIKFGTAFDGPSITTGTYQSTADGGVILTSTNDYNAAFLVDDSGDNIGASVRNVLGRTLLTTSQSAGSIRSVMGQMKLLTGVNTATGIYTGVQGYLEFVGTHTISSGAKTSGMDISLEFGSAKTITVASGGLLCGLHIETTGGSATISNSGNWAAIYIEDSGTVTDWGVGIDINNCTTGIDIGTSTTGITFTGAYTNGILLGTHDWGLGSTGIELGTTKGLMEIAGKVTSNNDSAGVYMCSYEQLALTSATQNADVSMFVSWNELYITPATTTVLTGSSHYAAVRGHVEASGTITSSTGVTAALWGSFIIPAAYTNNGTIAGCYVDGILHTSFTNTGNSMAYGIGAHTDPNQGDWEYAFYCPTSTVTTGIYIQGCTTQAMYANVSAVAGNSLTGSALCIYGTGIVGNNDVGIAAYLDATANGQSTGNWTYGTGIWLNLGAGFINSAGGWGGHEQIAPISAGVYIPTTGPTVSDADVIYGIKAELVGDTGAPSSNGCYFAALNVSQTAATRTAIFFAHQNEAVGKTTAKSVAGGAIALCDINGTMYYVNVYTA